MLRVQVEQHSEIKGDITPRDKREVGFRYISIRAGAEVQYLEHLFIVYKAQV